MLRKGRRNNGMYHPELGFPKVHQRKIVEEEEEIAVGAIAMVDVIMVVAGEVTVVEEEEEAVAKEAEVKARAEDQAMFLPP